MSHSKDTQYTNKIGIINPREGIETSFLNGHFRKQMIG